MNYLYVKYDHYKNFISENKVDRLSKNLKITVASPKSGKLINELFDYPIETEYKIEKYLPNILISFKTNSNNIYRLDIIRIVEKDKGNEFINHIAFSDYNNNLDDEDNYERLLDRNEMVEILNRIHFILLDLVEDKIINNKFCIGGTKLEKKNNIYEFLLKVIVGENGFKKEITNIYDTGYGLYFEV